MRLFKDALHFLQPIWQNGGAFHNPSPSLSSDPVQHFLRALFLVSLLALAACGGSRTSSNGPVGAGESYSIECAPYARQVTGIALYGDAADWWDQAPRIGYARARRPVPGGVIVFDRNARLPSGHVSVVTRVEGPRNITVTHANWVHGQIGRDEPVVDVSPNNDWSEVRVWWRPNGQMGASNYPVRGFVYASRGPRTASAGGDETIRY